jgi:transcriptional regulator with XRE-family HTH domain
MESLKRARKAQGMSLTDVAERSGLHAQAVARAERSGVDPRASTLLVIAKALAIPVCELLGAKHERRSKRRPER